MKTGTYLRLSLLAVLAMFAFVLIGCGGSEDKPGTAGGDEGVKPITMPKTYKGPAGVDPAVSAKDGGAGFDSIAAAEGWKTGTISDDDFQYYADVNAKKGGMFTHSEGNFPATFRPIGKDANTTTIRQIDVLVYQPLITLNPLTLEFLPVLATHWKVGEDGQTYFFRLNPNATFSDGYPVTTDDVLATYKMLTDSTILDPYANQLYGQQFDPPQKISKYIFSVRSKEKNWKNMLYFGGTSILPAHVIGNLNGTEFLKKYQYDMVPGSGPYVALPQEVRKGQSLTLTRLADWWQKDDRLMRGQYNFDKIKILSIEDPDQVYQRFRAGDLDFYFVTRAQWWAEKFDFDEVKRGLVQKRRVFNDNPQGLQGWAFNTRRAPFNDMKVREAVVLLINRQQLIDKIMYGAYTISDSYFPNTVYANPNNPKYRYNAERAQQLLQEAGYTKRNSEGILVNDKTGKPFAVTLPLVKGSEHIMTPVQQDLKKAGIKMDIRLVDFAQLTKLMDERNFDLVYAAYNGIIYPNPTGSFRSDMADAPNTNNITGFKNTRADELINKELVTFDQVERVKILQELDSILMAEKHYALTWYAPFQRLAYWNYLGHPKFYLSKVGDYRDIFQFWWVDTDKKAEVLKGRKDKSAKMEVGETDVPFWVDYNKSHAAKSDAMTSAGN